LILLSSDDPDDWRIFTPSLQVYEPEEDEETGLLDAEGRKLYRKRQPMGFDLSGRKLTG
jgi:hypothetical protein